MKFGFEVNEISDKLQDGNLDFTFDWNDRAQMKLWKCTDWSEFRCFWGSESERSSDQPWSSLKKLSCSARLINWVSWLGRCLSNVSSFLINVLLKKFLSFLLKTLILFEMLLARFSSQREFHETVSHRTRPDASQRKMIKKLRWLVGG